MAIKERSIGPLYLAKVPINIKRCPVHKAQVVEMVAPWRTGSTLVFPCWPFTAIAIGLWTRNIDDDIVEDFVNDQWLAPKWLKTPVNDISDWGVDAEAETEVTDL